MKKTLKSGYKGYKAYQFLEPGVDYTAFELAAEGNEFGEYIIDLTPEQEEFYEHVIAAHPMISLHEHPFCFPKHIEQTFDQVPRAVPLPPTAPGRVYLGLRVR